MELPPLKATPGAVKPGDTRDGLTVYKDVNTPIPDEHWRFKNDATVGEWICLAPPTPPNIVLGPGTVHQVTITPDGITYQGEKVADTGQLYKVMMMALGYDHVAVTRQSLIRACACAGLEHNAAMRVAAYLPPLLDEPEPTALADEQRTAIRDQIGQIIADYAAEHMNPGGEVGIDWCSATDIDPLADQIVALLDVPAAHQAPEGGD